MTKRVFQPAVIALGVAALISICPLSVAYADSSVEPAFSAPARVATPTPTLTPTTTASNAPSLNEPAPTPSWAEVGPNDRTVGQRSGARRAPRHYANRYGHRYDGNPVRTAAYGVAEGVAGLGSIAAYPFYCFPNYGSCSLKAPYRF
jgi:hypothetical protein